MSRITELGICGLVGIGLIQVYLNSQHFNRLNSSIEEQKYKVHNITYELKSLGEDLEGLKEQKSPRLHIDNILGEEKPELFFEIDGKRIYAEIDGKPIEDYFNKK